MSIVKQTARRQMLRQTGLHMMIIKPGKSDDDMIELSTYVVTHAGRSVRISARTRVSSDQLIVFLHGFGCSRESFDTAFDLAGLADFSICALDFPFHGSSGWLDPASSRLETYADVTRQVVEQLGPGRVFMVGHSMGGAVGLLATQGLRNLACFVNIEGNLVGRDCGIVSRETAAQTRDEFIHEGYPRFLDALRSSPNTDEQTWAGWYGRCDPAGLHQMSQSLVEWSDSGKLLHVFDGLPNRHYLHGARSQIGHLLPHIGGVPRYPIPDAGHFIMLDNPTQFYAVLRDIVMAARDDRELARTGVRGRYGAAR